MLFDALLAYAHFLALLSAATLLMVELVVFELKPSVDKWRQLALIDIGYFTSAIALLLTGLGRVFFGLKGAGYYWHDAYFHALWITYVFIALLSIVPTLSFLRWSKAAQGDAGFTPLPRSLRHVHNHLRLEIALFAIAPLFAVLMARGFGA